MNKEEIHACTVLLEECSMAEYNLYSARAKFFASCQDKTSVLRIALSSARSRGTALRLLMLLPLEERIVLLPELVEVSSVGHSDIDLCREVILSLPRDLLQKRLGAIIETILVTGTYEEYWRLAELVVEIDQKLLARIVAMARRHPDPDVQEVANAFASQVIVPQSS